MITATARSAPPAAAAAAPPRDLTSALFRRNLSREHGFEPLAVEGTLPADLRGTLYRNGPGLFEQFGRRYAHPFEADGAVSAVRCEGGRASGASRLTASAGLREERAAGGLRYGLSAPWLRRVGNSLRGRIKNTANTNVLLWQGRMFALMEAARPTEIDPRDLTTIGESDLGGTVVSAFSAHPHRVAARRTTYNFGLAYGRKTRLHLYALPDQGSARHLGALDLPGPPMLHDFIATESHLVFFLSPIRVNVRRMLLQLGSFADLFEWKPRLGTEVICVPIDRPAEPLRFTVDSFFQWHFANAFTRGGELVIDYVRYPDFASFYALGGGDDAKREAFAAARFHRAVIDPAHRTLRSEPRFDRPCDFPRVHPEQEGREHRYAWIAAGDLSGVARLEVATGAVVEHALPAHQRASEPVFVPRAGAGGDESDGHVLVLCHDGERDRAFLAVYDGRRLADGPRARVWFDHPVPITFHGNWLPA